MKQLKDLIYKYDNDELCEVEVFKLLDLLIKENSKPTLEDLKFLDGVQMELHSVINKYNDILKSQITSMDLDEPEYHDHQTVSEMNEFVQRLQNRLI